jgi:transposase
MTIVAYSHPFVVGVDTHARKHVYAIIAAAGGFPTTGAGINRAIA